MKATIESNVIDKYILERVKKEAREMTKNEKIKILCRSVHSLRKALETLALAVVMSEADRQDEKFTDDEIADMAGLMISKALDPLNRELSKKEIEETIEYSVGIHMDVDLSDLLVEVALNDISWVLEKVIEQEKTKNNKEEKESE